MTVAIYQGDGAQEEWEDDISLYSSVRHPNFLQLFGTVNSGSGIYAAIFYDELIPFEVFVDSYRHSPVKIVYIYAYCGEEYYGSHRYFNSISQGLLYHHQCTFWIRPATGRLCTDLTQGDVLRSHSAVCNPKIVFPLNEPIKESWVLDTLTLEEYHNILIFSPGQGIENAVEIAVLPRPDIPPGEWNHARRGTVVETQPGWIRYDASDVMDTTLRLHTYHDTADIWLSQANYIFSRLQIDSNLKDYSLVNGVDFEIEVLKTGSPPTGYLFVAPPAAFRSGITFRWPECPVYWSTDPSGVSRLSPEDANSLGFPGFALTMLAWVNFWDDGVYAGLRQIDQAKGFDPDTQDVARQLGHPLYTLAADTTSRGTRKILL
ncbi:hypothetical protein B0H16DRAFT_1889480 [Mycena metata]|uniref:Protein kinase domain-containing protein n=1 Tax=Mycena metata TaxID=1033252 RepID=A0AAD7N5C7_9AGAR|nr:hypothetical protein B0H16DRAFT_1889480 [Mycena metata]